MMKTLEESLNKDGLPLQILRNYLVPITEEINGIIRPFISRKICLRVEDDELILDSFPNEGADKSVFMHGGMESFILDIAFKITLSNFAKLPKCNILFLDEGISAFDGERLANIDILFSFIQNYFPKTVLITHLDSVKENIQEKIMISKVDGLSRIECFFLR
jgi:DNA repair exonuclease SbcCD ATPase subunit